MARKGAKRTMQTSATGIRRNRGFTLLELLVVLLVIGLLSGAGATVLLGGGAQKINRQAALIADFARTARRSALTSGHVQVLAMEGANLSIAPAGLLLKRKIEMTIRRSDDSHPDPRRDVIRFYPDGSSTGGVVTLSGGGEKRRVSVDWWGGIHIEH